MHIYLFLILFGVCSTFLLASFFVKNSDEHDKYVYKLACAIIAFTFFFSLAPMAADLTFVQEPQVVSQIANYTYFHHEDPGPTHHELIWNITTTYTFGNATVIHMSESYLFGWVCQGLGYVALALTFLYAVAMIYDLYQGRARKYQIA